MEEMASWGEKRGVKKTSGSSTASPMGSLTDDGIDDVNANASPVGDAPDGQDETLGKIAGINDDGYFGDASGQWLSLEPDTEITFATGNDKTAWEDLKDCWKLYGVPFATGLFTVIFFTVVLLVWSTSSAKTGGDQQLDADWKAGASGMGGNEAVLTDYQAWPWETIPPKCAHPEFHRQMSKKGRSLLPGLSELIHHKGHKIRGAGRRMLLSLFATVGSYTQKDIDLYSGDAEARAKAMDLLFRTRARCPFQTLSCGISGAPDLAPKAFGSYPLIRFPVVR